MKKTSLFILLILCTTFVFAQREVWQWAKQVGGSNADQSHSIVTDSSGNSYVTGYFQGTASFGSTTLTSSGDADIFVIKLDSGGNCLWVKQAGGNKLDVGFGIATDSSGNSYIIGYFTGTADFGNTTLTSGSIDDTYYSDIFVAKLDSSGNWLWAKQAGGSDADQGWSIAIDSSGNSYVTGFFTGTGSFGSTTLNSNGSNDIFVSKLDSSGNWLWAKQAGGNYWDMGYSIAIDSSGNSYVTGNFGETASFGTTTLTSIGTADIFVAKLDSNGNWLWAKQAGGTSSVAYGYSIATDSSGNSYVTGYFGETASFGSITLTSIGSWDIFVAKLDSNGNWLGAIKAGGTIWDWGQSIAIDSEGNSYVTGFFEGSASFGNITLTSSGSSDIFVAKAYIPYDSNDIVVVEGNTGLGAIYPNPFNPVANIPYNLSEISDADFYIYNVKGQLVRHINVGPQHPGYYQISWNGKDDNDKSCSSGIYYFIMKAGKQTFQRKAVLMK